MGLKSIDLQNNVGKCLRIVSECLLISELVITYEGGSKSPCNHLFFSSHWCIYTKVAVSTSSMNLSFMPCNMDSVARLVALRH